MHRFTREPLLHFFLLAILLLAAQSVAVPWFSQTHVANSVRVTAQQQRQLRDRWQRETGRASTAEEFQSLLHQYVNEQLLVREAQRLGLDRQDRVVRERLVKNMRFATGESYDNLNNVDNYQRLLEHAYTLGMAERDLVVRRRLFQVMRQKIQSQVDVSEHEVRAWYQAHPEQFVRPTHYRLTQLFFNPELRGERAWFDARKTLAQLQRGEQTKAINSDAFLLAGELGWTTAKNLRAKLGIDFAARVELAEPGVWIGPVGSAYGLHLVKVKDIAPTSIEEYADARAQAVAGAYAERDALALRDALAALRERYEIRVEPVADFSTSLSQRAHESPAS